MNYGELLFEAIGAVDDKYLKKTEEKSGRKPWLYLTVAAACLTVLVFCGVMQLPQNLPQPATEVTTTDQTVLPTETVTSVPPHSEGYHTNDMLPWYSLEQLVQESSLAAQVKVIKKEDLTIYSPTDKATGKFTDYTVTFQEIHRGSNAAGKTVTIRVENSRTYDQGGTVSDSGMAPLFSVGDSLLVFLYQPHMGGGFNTQGEDYFYLTGQGQGAYFLADQIAICSVFDESYALQELLSEIEELNGRYEVDEFWQYNYCVRHTKEQLETGVISQEEYDEFWARAEKYAEIK